jgi:hypothetical protein
MARKLKLKLKKPFFQTAVGRTLTGKNKAGEVLHGVVDALPVPNLLNPLRAAAADPENDTTAEILTGAMGKVDKVRFLVGMSISYGLVTGRITFETAKQVLQVWLQLF